jgi:alpha-galactosidase/6-phospho-beta-glucosidase family protein
MIGGGSSSFVPPLVRRLIESDILNDATLTLMDTNAEHVDVMDKLAKKVIESEESKLSVRSTTNQREALTGADFVICAISVGGMSAWENDMEIPARYGLVMHVADSIGPGGIMRAMRNAPVSRDVARDVSEVAPDAFVFNYTNPTTVEGLAMLTVPGVKAISLCSCSVAPSSPGFLAWQAGVSPEEIAMPPVVGGLNHCAAITELRLLDGTDALPLARANTMEPITKWGLDIYGVMPYCWEHWTEFHPGMQRLEEPYNGTAQGVKMRYGITTHSMEEQRARPRELSELAERWTAPDAGPVSLADLPMGDEFAGIEVIDIIEAIVDNRNEIYVVNTLNNGAIPNLPADAVVECSAMVNVYGVKAIHSEPLPETFAALLRQYVALQHQMVRAALSGDRDELLRALMLDPTTQSVLDIDQTSQLCDELLEANAQYLPLFNRG